MRIRILSDLHLEFRNWKPPQTEADIVVLAGDIHVGADGMKWAREQFADLPIIYVPGNHEFYGGHLEKVLGTLRASASERSIHLLDADEISFQGTRFLGATLWTDFALHGSEAPQVERAMDDAKHGMNDFRLIRYGAKGLFRPEHARQIHLAQVVRFSVDQKSQAARRPFEHRLIVRETAFRLSDAVAEAGIQQIYGALAADQSRNDLIFDDVLHAVEEGRSPVLLTERRDHLEHFAERLRSFVRHLVVLHGGMSPKQRRDLAAQLVQVPDDEERLVLATGRYLGEGFDDARLDTLFLAMPVAWKGTLVQYTGRLHRLHPRKREVRIFDYVDREVPMLLRMFEKRLRSYRAIGYARGEAPLGYTEPVEDSRFEYDEAALRHFEEDI